MGNHIGILNPLPQLLTLSVKYRRVHHVESSRKIQLIWTGVKNKLTRWWYCLDTVLSSLYGQWVSVYSSNACLKAGSSVIAVIHLPRELITWFALSTNLQLSCNEKDRYHLQNTQYMYQQFTALGLCDITRSYRPTQTFSIPFATGNTYQYIVIYFCLII